MYRWDFWGWEDGEGVCPPGCPNHSSEKVWWGSSLARFLSWPCSCMYKVHANPPKTRHDYSLCIIHYPSINIIIRHYSNRCKMPLRNGFRGWRAFRKAPARPRESMRHVSRAMGPSLGAWCALATGRGMSCAQLIVVTCTSLRLMRTTANPCAQGGLRPWR